MGESRDALKAHRLDCCRRGPRLGPQRSCVCGSTGSDDDPAVAHRPARHRRRHRTCHPRVGGGSATTCALCAATRRLLSAALLSCARLLRPRTVLRRAAVLHRAELLRRAALLLHARLLRWPALCPRPCVLSAPAGVLSPLLWRPLLQPARCVQLARILPPGMVVAGSASDARSRGAAGGPRRPMRRASATTSSRSRRSFFSRRVTARRR